MNITASNICMYIYIYTCNICIYAEDMHVYILRMSMLPFCNVNLAILQYVNGGVGNDGKRHKRQSKLATRRGCIHIYMYIYSFMYNVPYKYTYMHSTYVHTHMYMYGSFCFVPLPRLDYICQRIWAPYGAPY